MTLNVLYGALGREPLVSDVVRAIEPDVAVFTEASATPAFETVADVVGPHRAWSGKGLDRERVLIASRWPIVNSDTFGPAWSRSKWIRAAIQPRSGPTLTVAGVCLCPHPLWPFECWRVLEIQALLRALAPLHTPHLIAGDFNALSPGARHRLNEAPWWIRAQRISQGGFIPRWAVRRLADAGYVDCYRAINPGSDGFTVPAWDPQARIDYVFASPGLRASLRSAATQSPKTTGVKVRRTIAELIGVTTVSSLNGEATDHLAVWADFEWPPATG